MKFFLALLSLCSPQVFAASIYDISYSCSLEVDSGPPIIEKQEVKLYLRSQSDKKKVLNHPNVFILYENLKKDYIVDVTANLESVYQESPYSSEGSRRTSNYVQLKINIRAGAPIEELKGIPSSNDDEKEITYIFAKKSLDIHLLKKNDFVNRKNSDKGNLKYQLLSMVNEEFSFMLDHYKINCEIYVHES